MNLPTIQLTVSGDVFEASGTANGVSWAIRAEAETPTMARTSVHIANVRVADVTIHLNGAASLPAEVQDVGAALVWSGLRAAEMIRNTARVL